MINDIAKGIYDKLKADVTLMAAISDVYHVIAVQTATVPYVTFGLLTDSPIGTFISQTAIEDTTWWVNVFSDDGSKDAGDIAGYVMAVLDDASLTVAGYTALKCVREFIGSPLYDIDTNIYQIPLRYRIWIT